MYSNTSKTKQKFNGDEVPPKVNTASFLMSNEDNPSPLSPPVLQLLKKHPPRIGITEIQDNTNKTSQNSILTPDPSPLFLCSTTQKKRFQFGQPNSLQFSSLAFSNIPNIDSPENSPIVPSKSLETNIDNEDSIISTLPVNQDNNEQLDVSFDSEEKDTAEWLQAFYSCKTKEEIESNEEPRFHRYRRIPNYDHPEFN